MSGSAILSISIFHSGTNFSNEESSMRQILKSLPHLSIIVLIVKKRYGAFNSVEFLEPKLSHFREFILYGTCIQMMGL